MKVFRLFCILLACVPISKNAKSQDVLLNILTQNSGVVKKNGSIFLEVTICNTNPTIAVPAYKLKPQISFPEALVSIPDSGHILPPGWTVSFNKGAVIKLSNGTDQLPASGCRTILILLKAHNIGGPSTISGNLSFSNGVAPGTTSGSPTPGDNPADNTSTSTVRVIN